MKRRSWASARRSAFDIAGPGLFRRRMRVAAPLIVQSALLAGAAWWIAQSLFGHQTPIFAATAALICLTAGMGGRGRQAVDLFVGVVIGVLVGQGVRALDVGNDVWLIAPAIALAMSMAALIDPRPLTYIQSGTAVLIVVAVGASSSPVDYVLDAAVGGAVALLGSQVLFTPDPVKLVEGPVQEILREAAEAVRTAATALRRGSAAQAYTACGHARDAHGRLGELSRARAAAHRVTGRTVRGQRRAARLRQASQSLDDLAVLIAAILLLCEDVHAGLARSTPPSDPLPARLTELADRLTVLATHPLPVTAATPTAHPHPDGAPLSGTRPHPDVHLHDALTALHRLRSAPP